MKFFPERNKMPDNYPTDRIVNVAKQLTHALNHLLPATPFEHVGEEDIMALKRLANIFDKRSSDIHSKD